MRISRDGSLSRGSFNASGLLYEPYSITTMSSKTNYLSQLKEMAKTFGYLPDMVDRLTAHGFAPEEIEEFFYEGMCDY